jgi:hypothetical protein
MSVGIGRFCAIRLIRCVVFVVLVLMHADWKGVQIACH